MEISDVTQQLEVSKANLAGMRIHGVLGENPLSAYVRERRA